MFDAVLFWEAFKNWLSEGLGLPHLDLHLILGLVLTITIGRVMRVPLADWRPWLVVLALELVNEAFDFTRYHVSGWPWTPRPTIEDIAATMLPPLVLVLAARWHRARRARAGAGTETTD